MKKDLIARGDCPFCGGNNTFSSTRIGKYIVYHCFRASCGKSGKVEGEMSLEEICKTTSVEVQTNSISPFSSINRRDGILKYLEKYNNLLPYYQDKVSIKYDPKLNRVVYNEAHGRLLSGEGPKWHHYKEHNELFECGNSDIAIIVEDCISAVTISNVFSGCALNGTNLLDTYIEPLLKYKTVLVALDKDAQKKSIELARRLSFYCDNVLVLPIDKDLKYEEPKKIESIVQCLLKNSIKY